MNGRDALNGVASFAAQHPVALAVVVVAVVVLLSVRRSHRRTTRALARVRPAASTVALSTVVTALVILGVEWLVATSNPRPGTLLAVLAVPALLAGVTVGRLVAAAQLGNRIEQGVRR
jgi:ABC-type xylose transport system permease subunit